jgi:hypothetical protein
VDSVGKSSTSSIISTEPIPALVTLMIGLLKIHEAVTRVLAELVDTESAGSVVTPERVWRREGLGIWRFGGLESSSFLHKGRHSGPNADNDL